MKAPRLSVTSTVDPAATARQGMGPTPPPGGEAGCWGQSGRGPNGMTWSVHSRRIDPMTRSANAFCQGDRGAVRTWFPASTRIHRRPREILRILVDIIDTAQAASEARPYEPLTGNRLEHKPNRMGDVAPKGAGRVTVLEGNQHFVVGLGVEERPGAWPCR